MNTCFMLSPFCHLKKNIGFGRSHNHAFQFRKGTFFLVTNPDLEFEKNAIDKIVQFALLDDLSKVASWEFRQKPYEHPKYYDPITLKTFWSSGACLLINPKAFEEVGGYTKDIFMYGEDVELSYHFIDTGWDVKYCPFAVVWHYTYKQAGEFKPVQFVRSLSANALLKLRYGNLNSILASVFQLPYLMFREAIKFHRGSARHCFLIFFSYFIYLRLAAIFLWHRKKSTRTFPFCGFDYLIARHGAFYEHYRHKPDATPLVSVIMRTHGNQIVWLRESIASVLRQTYPNIELIIVEDGAHAQKLLWKTLSQKHRTEKLNIFHYLNRVDLQPEM
ncbi:MAG: glycosyltransferase [Gammaproteobacteria bacterium]|nr:glycosyltransferase [Gammaproteobacteria bacterium]